MFFDKFEKSDEHFTYKDYGVLIASLCLITVMMFFYNIKTYLTLGFSVGAVIGASVLFIAFVPLYFFVCVNIICLLTDAFISFINYFRHRKDGNK